MGVDPDLLFVFGVVSAVLALPALLASWTHGESPRKGALLLLFAMGMILSASVMRPGEYTVARAPQILGSVAGQFLN